MVYYSRLDRQAQNLNGRAQKEARIKEHCPLSCTVCPVTGDWANTPDTEDFLKKHSEAGYELEVRGGRLMELLAPARPCHSTIHGRPDPRD